jgi:hypothetical protein
MTPEQLEGYMKRLNLSYRHDDEPGPNGTLFSHFATRWYRSMMPPFGKRMQLLISLSDEGSLLTVMAPFVYHLDQAKRPAAFYEYLIELNYRIKVAHFQVDRRDGEVACVASVPVDNSNLSIDSFQKLLYSVPLVVDCHHKQTKAVLKTGKLPPVPKIPRLDPGFADLLMRVGGSLAKLREIVDAHERQAESGGPNARAPQGPSISLNPLPSPAADSASTPPTTDSASKPTTEPPQGPTPK